MKTMDITPLKACVHCRHVRIVEKGGPYCNLAPLGVSPVFGTWDYASAQAMRGAKGACKAEGRLWEARPRPIADRMAALQMAGARARAMVVAHASAGGAKMREALRRFASAVAVPPPAMALPAPAAAPPVEAPATEQPAMPQVGDPWPVEAPAPQEAPKPETPAAKPDATAAVQLGVTVLLAALAGYMVASAVHWRPAGGEAPRAPAIWALR